VLSLTKHQYEAALQRDYPRSKARCRSMRPCVKKEASAISGDR